MMRVEVTRIVADWLIRDLNPRIAAVPRDGADNAPPQISEYVDPAYPDTTIAVFDDTRHPWVAQRDAPPAYPALYVSVQGRVMLEGEPTPDGQIRAIKSPVQIAIRYFTQNSEYAKAVQEGEYTLRAVARSLAELSRNVNEAFRSRNSVAVFYGADPLEFYPIFHVVGNGRCAGAIVVNYHARDYAPSYV